MRVLFLTFYYEPDLCAGSFRSSALVGSILKLLPKGSVIDVVSTLPNRYSSFSVDAPEIESKAGLRIRRVDKISPPQPMRALVFEFQLLHQRQYHA